MIKTYSSQPPPRYEIQHEQGDDMCTVVFYTDIKTKIMPDGDTMYTSKILCISVQYTKDILRDVRDNYTEWLEMAIRDLF